jgi:hypothetical protein
MRDQSRCSRRDGSISQCARFVVGATCGSRPEVDARRRRAGATDENEQNGDGSHDGRKSLRVKSGTTGASRASASRPPSSGGSTTRRRGTPRGRGARPLDGAQRRAPVVMTSSRTATRMPRRRLRVPRGRRRCRGLGLLAHVEGARGRPAMWLISDRRWPADRRPWSGRRPPRPRARDARAGVESLPTRKWPSAVKPLLGIDVEVRSSCPTTG